jgi:hypothetical protein
MRAKSFWVGADLGIMATVGRGGPTNDEWNPGDIIDLECDGGSE